MNSCSVRIIGRGAQVEKICDLGGRDVQDNGQALHRVPCNRGKEPIESGKVEASANDELSSSSSPPWASHHQRTQRPNRVRGPHIALPSAMPLVACPAKQGEKQAGGRNSQTEPPATLQYCLRARWHQCH